MRCQADFTLIFETASIERARNSAGVAQLVEQLICNQ